MKALKLFAISIAVVMGFSACQKGPTIGNQPGNIIKQTLSANFMTEGQTKTATADGGVTVTWVAGDKIYYYTADGGEVRNYTIDAAGASATLDLEREAADEYFNLVYAGGSTPVFSTKTGTEMVFDGVKPAQNGTFAGANISVGRAAAGDASVTFKPVVPILKFTTDRPDVKTIILTGGLGTEKVAGDISVNPTAASPACSLSGEGYTSITVTIDTPAAGTYYIAVLPGSYSNGFTLTMKDDLGRVIGKLPANSSVNVAFGSSMLNFGSSDAHLAPTPGCPAPDGALSGVFSVGASKTVHFSKGNLWTNAAASPQTWSFEENQYDSTPSAEGTYNTSHVSHFFWETTGNYGSSATCVTDSGSDSDVVDWGAPYCSANGLAAGTWRTLSREEWQYLLSTRGTGDTYFKAGVTVCGKANCLVIAPDNNSTAIASSYDAAAWATAEANGFVCLPGAGYRDGSDAKYVGSEGDYWSSSAFSAGGSYFVYFNNSSVSNTNDYRHKGYSVRLVSEDFVRPVPAYSNITLPASVAHGSVSVIGSTTDVRDGSTVTLTLTPDGGYELDAITVTDAESHNVIVSGTGATRTFNMPHSNATVSVSFKLSDVLPGVFTISFGADGIANTADDVKVRFSKGNLWTNTTVSPQTWSFEDNQYDVTPSASGTYSPSHVSHFFWETTGDGGIYGSDYKCYTTSGASTDVVDWGVPYCSANGIEAGTWRTLTYAEWKFLLSSQGNGGRGKGNTWFKYNVTVCGIDKCLVIAPNGNTEAIVASYDAAAWAIAESKGFVCLPPAGSRDQSKTVNSVGTYGQYWSSSARDGDAAHQMRFTDSLLDVNDYSKVYRTKANSVRLVTVQ